MQCRKCKKVISWQWRYCPYCAARVKWKIYFTEIVVALLVVAVILIALNFRNLNISITGGSHSVVNGLNEPTVSDALKSEETVKKAEENGTIKLQLLDEGFPVESDVYIYMLDQRGSIYGGYAERIEKGIYVDFIPAGSYDLKVDKKGYIVFLMNDINVKEGKTSEIVVKLKRMNE
jgi:hypothetical protein